METSSSLVLFVLIPLSKIGITIPVLSLFCRLINPVKFCPLEPLTLHAAFINDIRWHFLQPLWRETPDLSAFFLSLSGL